MNSTDSFTILENSVFSTLETYSNVHRGSGHKSLVTTHLFDQSRNIVLDYLSLDKGRYVVIFCTLRWLEILKSKLPAEAYHVLSAEDIGLQLGVWSLAVKKNLLPKGSPVESGGGTARLIAPQWIVWDNAPDRFEPGTPAIINIIAFAVALSLVKKHGKTIFKEVTPSNLTVDDILYNDGFENISGIKLLEEIRNEIIGIDVEVPTAEGLRKFINLDYSASTPALKPVWNAFKQTLHLKEENKKAVIDEVKSICADVLNAPLTGYDIIFTSNATDAINIVAGRIGSSESEKIEPVIINTLLEHSSNDLPWRGNASEVIKLSINDEGIINHAELEMHLSEYNVKCLHGQKRIIMVAVTGASNVLGIYNDLEEISRIVHKYKAQLFVDGAQMVAHRKVEMERCSIDYLAFSAHKVYAPFGTGVLIAKKGLLKYSPKEIEMIGLSGKANPGGIAALGKALVLLRRIGMDVIMEDEQLLTKKALLALSEIEGLTIYGVSDPESKSFSRKGCVIVFNLKGMMSNSVAEELALRRGIGIRYGCHCAHILVKHLLNVSPGLQKFQRIIVSLFPKLRLPGLARISFGIGTTPEEIDTFVKVLKEIEDKSKPSSNNEVKRQIDEFIRSASVKVFS